MATIKGLPRFILSDASQFNAFVNGLSTAIGITDDAQVFIRPPEIRFGASGIRIFKDAGDDSMSFEDDVTAAVKLTDLTGASIPPVPPFVGYIHEWNLIAAVADRIYLEPTAIMTDATFTGVRIYNGTVLGNVFVGLYDSAGTQLAVSVSTAVAGVGAYQNVSFTGSYAATPGLYYRAVIYSGIPLVGGATYEPIVGRFVDQGSFALPASLTIPATPTEPSAPGHRWPGSLAIISGGLY